MNATRDIHQMKLVKTLILASALAATNASALSMQTEFEENAVNGIQQLNVKVMHDEPSFVTLTIKGVDGPMPPFFKSGKGFGFENIPVSMDSINIPIYFSVPKKGYFQYAICATTAATPVTDDSNVYVNVRVCNDVVVRNN